MASTIERMVDVIQRQPADSSYEAPIEENMRELAFERMVERGLKDSRNKQIIDNEEMNRRIRSWQR